MQALTLLSVVIVTALAGVPSAMAQTPNACLPCHQEKFAAAKPHYPAAEGYCTHCHETPEAHLRAPKDNPAAINYSEATCYECHTTIITRPEVHRAFKLPQKCSECHNPHGSDVPRFLKASPREVCLDCHVSKQRAIDQAKSIHGIINTEASCLECHLPHSAIEDKLLRVDPGKFCLTCHDREIQTATRVIPNIKAKLENSKHVHPGMENCRDCHNPHATPNGKLLRANYPVELTNVKYVAGTAKAPGTYEACFRCHSERATMSEKVGYNDTKFRKDVKKKKAWCDGGGTVIERTNLHLVHIRGKGGLKGRTCSMCHDIHGAAQPHLLQDRLRSPYKGVPLTFIEREDGGFCITCHKKEERAYSRIKPETAPVGPSY